MATLYADGTALHVGLESRVNVNTEAADLKFVRKVYTLTGEEAAADVIRICRLKQGQIVLPTLSVVTSDGAATTLTVDVGDDDTHGVGAAADPDRYCDGANVAAANTRPLFSATGNPPAATTPYVVGADCWLTATLATLATPVEGKKLTFLVAIIGA